ncbi:serine hydrolase domain-containing protein [Paenibacillus turpanensis]|uniref:serine hydrolase domain-containing protein n=1 Tax=Paenibacillus turpanensis TaxID=2689078 RepID=UPI00140CAA0C|nr:serine hydrolase domain-containing protein [Paenibacillus turpanensis]
MKHISSKVKAEKLLGKEIKKIDIAGAAVCVESGNGSFSWSGSAGNLTKDRPFFIASVTKLYTTAAVLILQEKGLLQLEDPVSRHIDSAVLDGIHRFHGKDYTHAITVRQLMAHTSGLPDYFQQRGSDGKSLQSKLLAGHDQDWTFEQVMDWTRGMKPHFVPGQTGKARYSDSNFQLLGRIIENRMEQRLSDAFRAMIFDPLGLQNTFLYEDSKDQRPAPLYYKKKPLQIPLAMSSFGPDGGIVSTAGEMMVFLRAFFEGRLFSKERLPELYAWNKIFFPLEYGVGLARFKLPRLFTPLKEMPELLGHSGLSGAFVYYCPAKDLYMAGTLNETAHPSMPYRLMVKLLHALP